MPDQNFIDKERLLKIDKIRIIYFVIFLAAFAMTEIGREIYRPFIYSNNINDFGIADTIGNFFGTITQIYFMLFLIYPTHKNGLFFFPFFVFGYSLYEFWQLILPGSHFDWKDIVATVISGIVALIIYNLMKNAIIENENQVFREINEGGQIGKCRKV